MTYEVEHPGKPSWVLTQTNLGSSIYLSSLFAIAGGVVGLFAAGCTHAAIRDIEGGRTGLALPTILTVVGVSAVITFIIAMAVAHVLPRFWPSTKFEHIHHAKAYRTWRDLSPSAKQHARAAYDAVMADTSRYSYSSLKLFDNTVGAIKRREDLLVQNAIKPFKDDAKQELAAIHRDIERITNNDRDA